MAERDPVGFPRTGARFRLEQTDATSYRVTVWLADGRRLAGALDVQSKILELEHAAPWVIDELFKLARVLAREPRARIVRWRPGPESG